ncbi:MAG: hypothetical protein K6G80_00020 [Treponema sp.]|nr:hypothetical protein [Treponema sp.]
MRKSKRFLLPLRALFLALVLSAFSFSFASGETVFRITEAQLETLTQSMQTMKESVETLNQSVSAQQTLLSEQNQLIATLQTQSAQSEKQAQKWKKAATIEACILTGFAAGFASYVMLK